MSIFSPLNPLEPLALETERVVLRRWRKSDFKPFARMNQDPMVMEFFPRRLDADETRAMIRRIESGFEEHGFGLYAVELKENNAFIGFVGLSVPKFSAHFTPCVEIGWRLASEYWGRGLATEAAREVMRAAFHDFGLEEIVSMTAVPNQRSRRVMEKLGMTTMPDDDFDHPLVPEGPLKRHVLYRKRR
ncbi:MAG: GNAT family N-acetyltransferase [Candidatus Obscuribacter sp.]|nr:GNAT family N-acetyltransferase [Candidatus Melainabacteria bacterium]MDX1988652.1 GNAT family N-acetyltransferase [Candidatus Obscuribacter sp.]